MTEELTGCVRVRLVLAVAGVGVPTTPAALGQIEFAGPEDYLLATGASSLTVADMNNDSLPDVAACERLESVSVFLNEGGGRLQHFGSIYEPLHTFSQVHSADFDRDGNQDLVWLDSENGPQVLNVSYGRGDGRTGRSIAIRLSRPAGSMALADVTGDGWTDIILCDARGSSSMVRVYRNTRDWFVAGQTAPLPYIDNVSVVSGDIDGDGDIDVAVLSLDDDFDSMYGWKLDDCEVRLLLNDGSGAFPSGQSIPLPWGGGSWDDDPFPVSLRLADMDGDRDLDLVLAAMRTANAESDLQLMPIENVDFGASFRLQEVTEIPEARIFAEVALGDLDTDGDIDVVVKAQSDLWTLENQGRFVLGQPARVEMGTYGGPTVALADINADGQLDLVEASRTGVSVFMNITPYQGPRLEHTPLKRNQSATLTVSDARSGELVYFLYSLGGVGNSVGVEQLGGLTLDLGGSVQIIGSAAADGGGRAQFQFTVPPNAPLTEVALQAVIRRGPRGAESVKTPFRTARIRE